MAIKPRGARFLKLIFRRKRISQIYPAMIFLSPSRSSSTDDINGHGMLKSRSEENLNKLSECMENMDDDVSKLFIEYPQTDLRKDLELFSLLNDYFITSKEVSSLCESLRKCLEDKESLPISDFLKRFQICHEDLAKMIVKLEKTIKQIDQKLNLVRGRRAIVTALIIAPVIALIFVSKLIAGIFGTLPMAEISSIVSSRWKKCTEPLKREKTAVTSMERGTTVALKEVEKISKLIGRLETMGKSIRLTERTRFKSILVDLVKETGRCDGFIQFGRTVALDKLVEFLSHGEKSSF